MLAGNTSPLTIYAHTSIAPVSVSTKKTLRPDDESPVAGTEALELGVASTCSAEGKVPDRPCVWEQLSLSKEVCKQTAKASEKMGNM